jgi:hypothetical protein
MPLNYTRPTVFIIIPYINTINTINLATALIYDVKGKLV